MSQQVLEKNPNLKNFSDAGCFERSVYQAPMPERRIVT
jgi:hypothetical protein